MVEKDERASTDGEWEKLGTQLPKGLKRQLKAACAEDGRQMREVLAGLVKCWLASRNSDDDYCI